ncbi:hypothetical protein N185_27925 [Sinorhizobium sp. GW3]|nr:hypothetical protein N185_27925 [Sinorhizobium sp. GW3]
MRIHGQKIAIVIAADRKDRPFDEDVGRACGIEGAAQMVAKIDDIGDPLRIDVGEHRFERKVVAVDVSENCKSHGRPPEWLPD